MSTVIRRKNPLRNSGRFLTEVWGELKKVQWPRWEELYAFTIIVIVAITVVGAYLGALDMLLSWVSDRVFFKGGR